MGLVNLCGFGPIDGGTRAESWRQQPGTPVYTTDLDTAHAAEALSRADYAQTVVRRKRMAARARQA